MQRFDSEDIKEMVHILKEDGVLLVPTDTVFGVCARMGSKQALENMRKVKNRPKEKAFPLMCSSLQQMESIAYIDEESKAIIEAFMPGPLTLIVKKKEEVEEYVNGGKETLALRMATSDTLKEMIEELGEPIFMSSANQSGEDACMNVEDASRACPLAEGILVGEVSYAKASTIIDATNQFQIVREGPIVKEDIVNVLKEKEDAR